MPPRLHATAMQRQDLLARLDNCLTKKLALITAPTGFGKTTLVSMWIAGLQFPSAWVTLDENDNDPARFWTYLCSALRTLDATLGKTTLSALASPQPPGFQALLSPLINDLGRLKEHHILVLDEYHTITTAEIHDGLAFLIQHLPETLHLVILSRSEPALPLGILRARGDLLEITTADLRFDATETQAFLQEAVPAGLSPAVIARLHERMDKEVNGMGMSPVNKAFVRWTFKHMLSKNAYTVAEMQAMIAQTPFGIGRIEVDGVGFGAWLEKK